MSLIKSISGIRGTIGGKAGDGLTPFDIVRFTAAYGWWLKKNDEKTGKSLNNNLIIIGRDSRISGEMVNNLVKGVLAGLGYNVYDIGLASTPTVEMVVVKEKAEGGIILTASHNPEMWNALKLLNSKGEFISAEDGQELLDIAENLENEIIFADAYKTGSITEIENYGKYHINKIIDLPYVDADLIRSKQYKVVIDCVNSVGGLIIPELLQSLGVRVVIGLNCEPNGLFSHNPEPLPEHLTEISETVVIEKADLGLVVDPDVDRLAIICEDGSFFGEENTLVAIADYILGIKNGNTVSNLSSSRGLQDITLKYGGKYLATPVGEVNVIEGMKKTNAVIGGEGNGGVIFPDLHYGRDALVGIALFLTYMAKKGESPSEIKKSLPSYEMSKKKIDLVPGTDIDKIFDSFVHKYSNNMVGSDFSSVSTEDGVKIDFENSWAHMRKSNTEPIIRIYTEAKTREEADKLADKFIEEIKDEVKRQK